MPLYLLSVIKTYFGRSRRKRAVTTTRQIRTFPPRPFWQQFAIGAESVPLLIHASSRQTAERTTSRTDRLRRLAEAGAEDSSNQLLIALFLGGFLALRFGAFLFPMPQSCHIPRPPASAHDFKLHHLPTAQTRGSHVVPTCGHGRAGWSVVTPILELWKALRPAQFSQLSGWHSGAGGSR